MQRPQRTILFLIADTGAGHRSAANAIRNAITVISQAEQEEYALRQQRHQGQQGQQDGLKEGNVPQPPTYRIEIVDVFEEYSRFPLREAVKLYGPTIRYNPSLYGRVFHMSNQAQSVAAVRTVATPLVLSGLMRLITNVQPDVIVSIHPMLNHVTIEALEILGIKIPFFTVVTDLVSVHYSWYAPGADAYIVPTEYAHRLYLERGLDPARVHVLGMPIDPKFTLPLPEKAELQRRLGLEPGLPVVLLVGGGDGAGGLRAAAHAISQARLPVQLLIITGRNKRLYVHLQRSRTSLRVPTRVFGFVHNMPEMMHASDVIVTKAGPGTICESLACHLPIILSGYVPGQEEGNVNYVLENNVGVMAYDSVELINSLRRLIKPGSELLKQQVENARRISRPRASFDIAEYILSFMSPAGEPGLWQGVHWQKPRRRVPRPLRVGSSVPTRKLRPGVRKIPTRALARKVTAAPGPRGAFPRLAFLRRPVRNPLNPRAFSRRLSRLTRRKRLPRGDK